MYRIEHETEPLIDPKLYFAKLDYPIINSNLPIIPSQMGLQHQGKSHYTIRQEDSGMYFLLLCLDGNGELIYKGNEYKLEPYDMVLINAGHFHKYQTGTQRHFEYFYMNLYGSGCFVFENALYQNKFRILKFPKEFGKEWLFSLLDLVRDSTVFSVLELSRKISDFFYAVLQENIESRELVGQDKEISYAIHILEERYQSEITIADIAKECNLSVEHFIRKFKCSTGKTPKQYLSLLRLERAKSLMENSEYSLSQIAQFSGFGNFVNMANCFKKEEKTTPRQYIKRLYMAINQ